MNKQVTKLETEKKLYSDDEINVLAEWFQNLTIAQLDFLKQSYDAMLVVQAKAHGNGFVQ
jgi:hypothetical protein